MVSLFQQLGLYTDSFKSIFTFARQLFTTRSFLNGQILRKLQQVFIPDISQLLNISALINQVIYQSAYRLICENICVLHMTVSYTDQILMGLIENYIRHLFQIFDLLNNVQIYGTYHIHVNRILLKGDGNDIHILYRRFMQKLINVGI